MLATTPSHFYFFLFLSLVSIQSIFAILCYECNNCTNIESCTCDEVYETNQTDVHCILLRQTLSNGVFIEIKHRENSFSNYHIYNTHYISVDEAISYDPNTERWSSLSNSIVYGCQIDLCNRDDLLRKLPSNGLSLMLPSAWLNQNLQRKTEGDWTICRRCNDGQICSDSPATFNMSECLRQDCRGSCFVTEVFENAESAQLCYDSSCSDDTTIGPAGKLPQVNITAFYYIDRDQFDIVEIDVVCNADRCDTLDLFKDIQEKTQKNLQNIQPFLNHNHSIYSTSILFLMMILFLQIVISY